MAKMFETSSSAKDHIDPNVMSPAALRTVQLFRRTDRFAGVMTLAVRSSAIVEAKVLIAIRSLVGLAVSAQSDPGEAITWSREWRRRVISVRATIRARHLHSERPKPNLVAKRKPILALDAQTEHDGVKRPDEPFHAITREAELIPSDRA